MIEIRGLRKTYATRGGRVAAVRGIDHDVPEHSFCVLLGPSGCGKTTVLRCVAGLEEPDEGEIKLGGQPVYSSARDLYVPPERRDIGMVFQSYAVWPHMNVFQVVAYPLTDGRRRVPKQAVAERVQRALELVQLGGLASRPVTDLSGGQQQRVALARALVAEPGVLLMDEPLSNLDARLREDMRAEIRRLSRQLGLTILYVTHDQAEALSLADQVCVVHAGEIVDRGAPEQVYASPANRYSAEFVGRSLFLPGRVRGDGTVESALGTIALGTPLPEGCEPGSAVTLAMRPEHVVVPADALTDGLVVEGTVVDRLFLGESLQYDVTVGEVALSLRLATGTTAEPGDRLRLGFPANHWHIFPAEPA
jgi:iron(III) transport system ATP-binding protein